MYTIDTIDDILSRTIYGLAISNIENDEILTMEIPDKPINTHFMNWVSNMYELSLARINNMNFQALTMDKSEYETEEIVNKTLLILQKLISKKRLRVEYPPKNCEKFYKLNDDFKEHPNELVSEWNNDFANNLYNLYINLMLAHFEILGYYSVRFLKEIRVYSRLIQYEQTNPLLSIETRRTKIQKIMKNKGERMNNIILINSLFRNLIISEFFQTNVFEGIYRRTIFTYDNIKEIPFNLLDIIDRVNTTFGLYIGMINNQEYAGLKDGYMAVIPDELKIVISRVIEYNYSIIGKEYFLKCNNIFLPTIKVFEATKDLVLKERLPLTIKYSEIVNQLSKIYVETNKETTDLMKVTKIEINKRYHDIINYFLENFVKASLVSPVNSLTETFTSIFSEENKRIRDNYFLVGISNINDAVDSLISIIKYKNELIEERVQAGSNTVEIDKQLGSEYHFYGYYSSCLDIIIRNLLSVNILGKSYFGKCILEDSTIYGKTLQMVNSTIYNLIKINYFKDKNYVADINILFKLISLVNMVYGNSDKQSEIKIANMIVGETREKLKELCNNESYELLVEEFEKIEILLDNMEEEEEYIEEIPDDFLDPITYTPMENPVILPSSGNIVDKKTIVNQLLHNEIDPYSRAKLTIEELEEFNSKEENIIKIKELVDKFKTWKESNKKQKKNEVREFKVKIEDEEYIIGGNNQINMDELD
jgi:hypothetical protein